MYAAEHQYRHSRSKKSCIPEPNNELICPQQAKEVVDEQVLELLVPVCVIVTAGIVGAGNI